MSSRCPSSEAEPSSPTTPNIDSAPCPTLQSATTQDVFESVVKGRKSWKLRGGEVVWPPELEAALLEGLENYEPDDSRETRLLGRFPMRNRFISDYIFQKTGKRRTAKQVGSRLQQLRDTCGGKRLLKLLSPITKPPFPAHRRATMVDLPGLCYDSSSENSSEPDTPVEGGSSFSGFPKCSSSHANICIDILPEDSSYHGEELTPTEEDPMSKDVVRLSKKPRRLSTIDPTITFISRRPMAARSVFKVHLDADCVHSESVALTQRTLLSGSSAPDVDGLLYSCALVPGFWKTIRASHDPTRYTITQEVYQQSANSNSSTVVYSANYRFSFPAGYSPPTTVSLTSPLMSNEPLFVMDSGSPSSQPSSSHTAFMDCSPPHASASLQFEYDHPKNNSVFYGYDHEMAPPTTSSTEHMSFSSSPLTSQAHLYDTTMLDTQMQWRQDGHPPPPPATCFPTELSNYVL